MAFLTFMQFDKMISPDGPFYDEGVELTEYGELRYSDCTKNPRTYNLHSLYFLLWANFGAFVMNLLTQPDSDIQFSTIITKQHRVRHYCVSQLKKMWQFLSTNLKLSEEKRTLLINKCLNNFFKVRCSLSFLLYMVVSLLELICSLLNPASIQIIVLFTQILVLKNGNPCFFNTTIATHKSYYGQTLQLMFSFRSLILLNMWLKVCFKLHDSWKIMRGYGTNTFTSDRGVNYKKLLGSTIIYYYVYYYYCLQLNDSDLSKENDLLRKLQ